MSSPPPLPAAVPGIAAPPPPLADFGDWLSPMIVKELRQGLRTWIFVGAFIVLQAILVMTLLISASAGNQMSSSVLFWILVAGILVFIVPLRGFNALAGEMKSETLDLLMLTRLDSFRIAVGKWIALVAQSTLITISVMPYVVLRYFGGGVDLGSELLTLLLLWMLSAAVTAVAVAFSALPSVIVRTLVLLATWFFCFSMTGILTRIALSGSSFGGVFGFGGADPSWWLILAVLVPVWAFGCYFVLDVGATAIAPLASNHATRKRLISLGMMLVCLAFVWLVPHSDGRGVAMACLVVIAVLATFDCLTETPTNSPSVYTPFVARGALGRFLAYFLAPGWATGFFFYLLIAALVLVGLYRLETITTRAEVLATANCLLTPITPLALALVIFRRQQRLLGSYLVCALVIVIASLLLMFMTSLSRSDAAAMVGIATPPSALMLSITARSGDGEAVLIGGAWFGIVYVVILLMRMVAPLKSMHQAMAVADASRTAEPASDRPATPAA